MKNLEAVVEGKDGKADAEKKADDIGAEGVGKKGKNGEEDLQRAEAFQDGKGQHHDQGDKKGKRRPEDDLAEKIVSFLHGVRLQKKHRLPFQRDGSESEVRLEKRDQDKREDKEKHYVLRNPLLSKREDDRDDDGHGDDHRNGTDQRRDQDVAVASEVEKLPFDLHQERMAIGEKKGFLHFRTDISVFFPFLLLSRLDKLSSVEEISGKNARHDAKETQSKDGKEGKDGNPLW